MADTIKSSNTLVLNAEFVDEDTRTISVDDPNATIVAAGASASASVSALGNFIKTNNILIGDKAGADFSRIKSAKVVIKSVTNLDLNDVEEG